MANHGKPTDLAGTGSTAPSGEENSRLLEMIAKDAPLNEILTAPTLLIESPSKGLFCSVMLLDKEAAWFAASNQRYRPFADKLEQLAKTYQSKALLSLIEGLIKPERPVP